MSHFGSTIENALNSKELTLTIGQTALSEGQAVFSDVAVGNKIAISFYFPQENDPLFGFMWATTEDGKVKLIEHPETFPETADSSFPKNKTTIEENDLDSFDEAHRIEGVQIEKINPALLKDGILDTFALDGPQQIILYSYANVDQNLHCVCSLVSSRDSASFPLLLSSLYWEEHTQTQITLKTPDKNRWYFPYDRQDQQDARAQARYLHRSHNEVLPTLVYYRILHLCANTSDDSATKTMLFFRQVFGE